MELRWRGLAIKTRVEQAARVEVERAIVDHDDKRRGSIQFNDDSSNPGGARSTLMR